VSGRWVYPLDPECSVVRDHYEAISDDPYSGYVGGDVMGDINEAFERKHRASCKRCQEYGAANVDVEY
jgi:hypothetical protein